MLNMRVLSVSEIKFHSMEINEVVFRKYTYIYEWVIKKVLNVFHVLTL